MPIGVSGLTIQPLGGGPPCVCHRALIPEMAHRQDRAHARRTPGNRRGLWAIPAPRWKRAALALELHPVCASFQEAPVADRGRRFPKNSPAGFLTHTPNRYTATRANVHAHPIPV